jgi:hypothetical protein
MEELCAKNSKLYRTVFKYEILSSNSLNNGYLGALLSWGTHLYICAKTCISSNKNAIQLVFIIILSTFEVSNNRNLKYLISIK